MGNTQEIEFRWTQIDPDLSSFMNSESPLELSIGSTAIEFRPDREHGAAWVATTKRTFPNEAIDALLEWESGEAELATIDDAGAQIDAWFTQIGLGDEARKPFEEVVYSFESVTSRLSGWITWTNQLLPESDLSPRSLYESVPRPGNAIEYRLPPNDQWRQLPDLIGAPPISDSTPLGLSNDPSARREFVEDLEDESNQAPLAWSLFQSAVRASQDRRVAIVLAVSAAEVAVKHFLVAVDPSVLARWLLIDEQAPSWNRLVREGLPKVTSRRIIGDPGKVLPKSMIEPIVHGFRKRNGYVHSGIMNLDEDLYHSIMQAVSDLLYALEWMRGEDWAFRFISGSARAAWDTGGRPERATR